MSGLEEVMKQYENTVFRTALSYTGDREDALDMVQETFLRWLTKRPEFASPEHEKAWLLRVCMNLCTNLIHSAARTRSEELLDIYPAKDEEEQGLLEEVMALGGEYRSVIYLYYYEGYSTKEIAEMRGTKESTVRSQLHRARKLLKDRLEENQ